MGTGGDVLWALLGLAAVAGVVVARRPRSPLARPGPLVALVARRPVGRVVLLVGWAWLGWHLFAR